MLVLTKLLQLPEEEEAAYAYQGLFDNEDLAMKFLFEREYQGQFVLLDVVTNDPDALVQHSIRTLPPFVGTNKDRAVLGVVKAAQQKAERPVAPRPSPTPRPMADGENQSGEGVTASRQALLEKKRAVAPPKARNNKTDLEGLADDLVDLMEPGMGYGRGWFMEELELTGGQWTKLSEKLLSEGRVRREGIKRGTKYYLVLESSLYQPPMTQEPLVRVEIPQPPVESDSVEEDPEESTVSEEENGTNLYLGYAAGQEPDDEEDEEDEDDLDEEDEEDEDEDEDKDDDDEEDEDDLDEEDEEDEDEDEDEDDEEDEDEDEEGEELSGLLDRFEDETEDNLEAQL